VPNWGQSHGLSEYYSGGKKLISGKDFCREHHGHEVSSLISHSQLLDAIHHQNRRELAHSHPCMIRLRRIFPSPAEVDILATLLGEGEIDASHMDLLNDLELEEALREIMGLRGTLF
jgi:hypothetical protein